jgi:hypothetical protein
MKKAKLNKDHITVDERLQQLASVLIDKLICEIQNKTLDKKFLVKKR